MITMPYHAFMDESIQQRNGREIIAMAGYISSYARWIDFEKEWQQVLNNYSIPTFHMTDFIARKKQFKNDWSNDKRDLFMERLTTTVSEHTMIGLGCAIFRDEYEKAIDERVKRQYKHPYYFCLKTCIDLLVNWQHSIALPKPIEFLFDNKPGWTGVAGEIFYEMKERGFQEWLGNMAYGSKETYKPLQAADLIVYEVARFLDITADNPDAKLRTSMEILSKKLNLLTTFPREEGLRLVSDITLEFGVKILRS